MIKIIEESDGIARLILNQPATRNAINIAMWHQLDEMLTSLESRQVRVVLVESGVGGIFCPGADIAEFPRLQGDPALRTAMRTAMQGALNQLERLSVPTIAAIDGACVGGGVSLAMACDLRLASPAARFGVTPAKLGLVYSAEDVRRLHAVIGSAQTRRLLFTGEMIDAAEALRIGMVHQLTSGPTCMKQARSLAASIAANSAVTHHSVKAIVRALDRHDAPPDTDGAFEDAFVSADAAARIETMLAVMDRRN